MVIRIIGTLIALVSLYYYIFHLAKRGEQPHTFWALVAGIVLMFGVWLALPGRRGKR
jgi:hypothetical protein